jgi:hypothetical protein
MHKLLRMHLVLWRQVQLPLAHRLQCVPTSMTLARWCLRVPYVEIHMDLMLLLLRFMRMIKMKTDDG